MKTKAVLFAMLAAFAAASAGAQAQEKDAKSVLTGYVGLYEQPENDRILV
jgi:hypothetical protein